MLASRKHLVEKIWTCCKKLFSLGLSERRDAYTILSLSLSTGSNGNRNEHEITTGVTFDLTAENDFWDEIKRGLVSSVHALLQNFCGFSKEKVFFLFLFLVILCC